MNIYKHQMPPASRTIKNAEHSNVCRKILEAISKIPDGNIKSKIMRLSRAEIESIASEAKKSFGNNTNVFLFGSRTDDTKKGGDIDLIIKPDWNERENFFKNKIEFLVNLKERIGEQKIDVLIAKHNDKRNIIKHGLGTGKRLC